MWVIGLGMDHNYHVLDVIRDRISLTERCAMLFRLHKKWQPLAVGYERYGLQADIEHVRDTMNRTNYHFVIEELGGATPKLDRIRRLIPVFEQGRMWLPHSVFKTDYEGKTQDLIEAFVTQEYESFPVSVHDDMLDAMARILDEKLNTIWPRLTDNEPEDRYARAKYGSSGGDSAWSA